MTQEPTPVGPRITVLRPAGDDRTLSGISAHRDKLLLIGTVTTDPDAARPTFSFRDERFELLTVNAAIAAAPMLLHREYGLALGPRYSLVPWRPDMHEPGVNILDIYTEGGNYGKINLDGYDLPDLDLGQPLPRAVPIRDRDQSRWRATTLWPVARETCWIPLLRTVGEPDLDQWMFMGALGRGASDELIHQYKHALTRQPLNLDQAGSAYTVTGNWDVPWLGGPTVQPIDVDAALTLARSYADPAAIATPDEEHPLNAGPLTPDRSEPPKGTTH